MTEKFYAEFENRFRGSRELVRERLKTYLPFVSALSIATPELNAIDLGCGRGEWLELLAALGFRVAGVDLDDDMLAECRSRNLQVVRADAVEHLRTLPSSSQGIVTAFHVIEHMPFTRVRELVDEAFRVLAPGGLLILETPNSENLIVGTSSFYLDPTHVRPVHPLLVAFTAEISGFQQTKVVRLNGEPLPESDVIGISDVLNGVSPDISILAKKSSGHESNLQLKELFAREWGISLAHAASAFDSANRARSESTRQSLELLDRSIRTHDEILLSTQDELTVLKDGMNRTRAELVAVHQSLVAIHNSRSWRWTAPIRTLRHHIRVLIGKTLRFTVPRIRDAAHSTPWTKALARSALRSSPLVGRLVSRFLGQPIKPMSTAVTEATETIARFQDLRSVKLMTAIAVAEEESSASVIHIGRD